MLFYSIINHREEENIEETTSGIYVFNKKGERFRISLDSLGELEVNCCDSAIVIRPEYTNQVIIKTDKR